MSRSGRLRCASPSRFAGQTFQRSAYPTPDFAAYYSARLRVIDRQQKAVIAEGLKRELAKAADYCTAFFRGNTFRA